MENNHLPPPFLERMKELLGNEMNDFLESYKRTEATSIRLHPYKFSSFNTKTQEIKWCKNGYFLQDRPSFALDPAWHAGAYYVQESSSMLLEQAFEAIKPKNGSLKILDLCAAPGGKSTHLLSLMSEDDLLVSNEIIPKRNAILVENIQRWGMANMVVTKNEASEFQALGEYFDIVAVDAPCSGEGLFRKQPDAVNEWSEQAVEQCAIRQENILVDILPCLKIGGHLIYSTCTFETAENEAQIEKLIQSGQFELIPLSNFDFPEIKQGLLPRTLRCWPQHVNGSGFFIALLKKINNKTSLPQPNVQRNKFWNWANAGKESTKLVQPFLKNIEQYQLLQSGDFLRLFPQKHIYDLAYLGQQLQVRHFGIDIGEIKKSIFTPAHHLSYTNIISEEIPSYEVNETEALAYLRKQDLEPKELPKSWAIVKYKRLQLGWIKHLKDRVNNYLPVNRMLRS